MRAMIAILVLYVGGCDRAPGTNEAAGGGPDTTFVPSPASDPVSLTEVAPGDTATILRVMRGTMADIDALLSQLERRDTTLPPVGQEAARHVTVWVQSGVPRKLTVSEPNDAGAMTAESQYWLVGGELRVVQQPFAGYVFYGDRILVWTDGSLEPVPDIPDDDRMARELELLAEARARLAVFGLKLP